MASRLSRFAADLLRGTHRIRRDQDPAVETPQDDGGCRFVVEGEALGDDVWRLVGAILSAARAHRRRMSSHRRPAGAVQRARSSRVRSRSGRQRGLLHVSGDSVEDIPPPAAFAATIASRTMSRTTWSGTSSPRSIRLDGLAERVPARRDRAAAHRSRCTGCGSARRSARPESLARARGRDHQYSRYSSPDVITSRRAPGGSPACQAMPGAPRLARARGTARLAKAAARKRGAGLPVMRDKRPMSRHLCLAHFFYFCRRIAGVIDMLNGLLTCGPRGVPATARV